MIVDIEAQKQIWATIAILIGLWAQAVLVATEILKRAARKTPYLDQLPDEFYPLLAIALGVAAALVWIAPGEPRWAVLYGVAIGMAAIGEYKVGRAVEAIKHQADPSSAVERVNRFTG